MNTANSPTPAIPAAAMADELRTRSRARSAAIRHRYMTEELQQQFIIARFMDRVFTIMPDDWMIKGGYRQLVAMGFARYSTDGDLQAINTPRLADATDQLIAAARYDLGDHLRYTQVGLTEFDNISGAAKINFVVSFVTGQHLNELEIDVSVVHRAVTEPVEVEPHDPIGFPELERPKHYLLYPTENQIADKTAAILETTNGRPSRRYHDLPDLEALARQSPVDGQLLRAALTGEFAARNIEPPAEFNVPNQPEWTDGYRTYVEAIPELANHTIDDALTIVKTLIDPILRSDPVGTWDPQHLAWRSS